MDRMNKILSYFAISFGFLLGLTLIMMLIKGFWTPNVEANYNGKNFETKMLNTVDSCDSGWIDIKHNAKEINNIKINFNNNVDLLSILFKIQEGYNIELFEDVEKLENKIKKLENKLKYLEDMLENKLKLNLEVLEGGSL